MQFLKKHYEKLLLSLVLLLLAGVAVWLFLKIEQKREEMEVSVTPTSKPKQIAPTDLTPYNTALQKAKTPVIVNFGPPHLLFNAVTWKQKSDGTLVKMQSSNPADALTITKINPLNLIIAFDRVAGTGFYFGVTREAATREPDRKKVARYLNEGGKSDLPGGGVSFALKKVEGGAENPQSFAIELNDTKQQAVLTPAQPFMRLEGYSADLRYDLENKTFKDQRIGSTINFAGESYKIIAISENEVRVQAISNQKQTTVRWNSPK